MPADGPTGDSYEDVGEDTPQGGPWDSDENPPDGDRVDLGSLLVPQLDGVEVRVDVAEDQVVAATLICDEGALQVQAFAAPKSSGLWDEVRREIRAELDRSGGTADEVDGLFGVELRARVPGEAPGKAKPDLQPVRFVGIDGPRWFLRGVLSGPVAVDPDRGHLLTQALTDIVVVRGDAPIPPRDLLELRLPREAQEALQAQQEQDGDQRRELNPFERGPEITEIR